MSGIRSYLGDLHGCGRTAVWIFVVCCLGLGGCNGCPGLMGPHFQKDALFDSGRQLRQPDRDNEFSGTCNKARDIEANLGVGRQ